MAIDRRDMLKNLKKFDLKTQKLVLDTYNIVSDLLIELMIDNSVGLRQAQNRLMKAYDEALLSTNFVATWQSGVISTIVASTYDAPVVLMSKSRYKERLLKTSLFKDNIVLSTRIRSNSYKIVRDQKKILRQSLAQGKTVAEIVGNIGQDVIEGFERALPDYIDNLRKQKIAGKKFTTAQIKAVKTQIGKIKTVGLQADYNRLVSALEIGKNVEKQVFFAMERKTKFYSQRLARTETNQAFIETKNQEAMDDPDTKLVKNITSGDDPCNYCIASENLGFVPVENATLATHHPNCSCSSQYKKTSKNPQKWSNDTFKSRLQTEINKQNSKSKRLGRPITYIDPETPTNLRRNAFRQKLG